MVAATLSASRRTGYAHGTFPAAKAPVSEDSQIDVPESFIALYRRPGRSKLSAPRDEIATRYGFCEDLAQALTDQAGGVHHGQGVDEDEVLSRCLRGLQTADSGVDAAEARWVVRRLAELLGWPEIEPDSQT